MAESKPQSKRRRTAAPPPVIELSAEEVRGDPTPEQAADFPDNLAEVAGEAPSHEEPAAAAAEAAEAPAPEPKRDPETEPQAAPAGPSPSPGSGRRPGGLFAMGLVAIVLLAAVLGAWLYRGYGGVIFARPTDERLETMNASLGRLAADLQSQGTKISALEASIAELKDTVDPLSSAQAELKKAQDESRATSDAIRQSLEAASKRLDEADRRIADTASALDALRTAISASGQSSSAAATLKLDEVQAAIDSLARRVGDAEKGLGSAATELEGIKKSARDMLAAEKETASAAAALGHAHAALAAKLQQGAPYAAELDRLATLLPGAPGFEVLRLYADKGVSSLDTLDARLGDIAAEIARTTDVPLAEPAESGLWPAIRQRLASVVKVRRIDEADWPALMERARGALKENRLPEAIQAIEQAGSPPPRLADWIGGAKARRDADRAMEALSAAALRQLGSAQP
jgi:hypothetical protein